MGAQTHSTRAEYLFKRSEGKVHVKDVERLLRRVCYGLGVAHAEIVAHGLAVLPLVVLLGREVEGGDDVCLAHARAYDVTPQLWIILGEGGDVGGIGEIGRKLTLHEVLIITGDSLLHGIWHHYRVGLLHER